MSSTQRWIAARCAPLKDAVTLMTRCHIARPGRARSAGCGRTAASRSRAPGLRVASAGDHRLESLQESQRLGGRQRRLILDGIGDPAQQIGIGDRNAQRGGQLRNRQREGARDVRKYLVLIDLIGNAGIHADSISENEGIAPSEGPGVAQKTLHSKGLQDPINRGLDYSRPRHAPQACRQLCYKDARRWQS